ncbi:mRNA 3 end processing RNA14 [Cryptosporidium sp. chipmunk genotype I]|uniref:mRNA 3 end processing RNA14 n=1 Tax=Cryptosporidium sp. chipmunk genotype I TaxID=1280935 RepID=UPI00351A3D0C|nr:mRNA 3 end processing RNA14 [Cryptosporidium sp. chipmunk genotype I]
MKKGITSLIDSIVEKNPYDYSLWENIFTVKSESEVFERALEFFPTSPIVWKRYIEYLQSQKNTDEKVLLGIYQRCIHQCSCIMIWKLFIPFVDEKINSLKDRYQIYQLALDTVGSDPRSGFIWQRMYKLRLLVYNTLISKNEASLSGNTLLLNPFETSTIPIISEQIEECFQLGDKIATIVTLRQFFIQWLTTPVGNLETAFIAYSLFENSISSSSTTDVSNLNVGMVVGGVVTVSESASKLVTKNLLQSGEKLVNISKIVHKNMMVLVDGLHEDIPAKPLDKSNRNEWMSKFIPWKRYILFEKSNPLGLDKSQYFNRVSYSFRNCLLYFSYHPEVWYEYFIFVWNSHPVQLTGVEMATELLSSAIQRFLPKDEILKLVLAEVYELRKKLDKVMHLYHSMVYIESSGEVIQMDDSAVPVTDDSNVDGNVNMSNSNGVKNISSTAGLTNNNNNNNHNKNLSSCTGGTSIGNIINHDQNNHQLTIQGEASDHHILMGRIKGNPIISNCLGEGIREVFNANNGNSNNLNDTRPSNVMIEDNSSALGGSNTDFLLGERTDGTSISKQYSQMITSGLSHKQYSPVVSAVVIIEYLNFILRSTNDKVIWREVFLDYVKRSPRIADIKWICYSQALNEWRLYNNLDGAYQIFYFGMYYRHLFLDVSFMSCFVSFLLDTGKLQQARNTLQSCIYEIYKETGKVPKQLWLQWFHLERMSGSSIYSLNYLNRIYQLQKDGKNVEIDMLLSKRQQEAWHSILGAPEFAELNKEYIGSDNIDPKTKVYGHSYVFNPFDDDHFIGGLSSSNVNDNNNNNNTTSTSSANLAIQNQRGVNSAFKTGAIENSMRSLEANSGNKFILTCPSKFRTAFECFRFGSIYPNSSWTEFYLLEGEEGRNGCFGGIGVSSQSEDERMCLGHCKICSKSSSSKLAINSSLSNGNSGSHTTSNTVNCNCQNNTKNALSVSFRAVSEGESKCNSSVDCNHVTGGRIIAKYHNEQSNGITTTNTNTNNNNNITNTTNKTTGISSNIDLDDDFESFLLERPFEFRLVQNRIGVRKVGVCSEGRDRRKSQGLFGTGRDFNNTADNAIMKDEDWGDNNYDNYYDNSDLDSIEEGLDDEEMEYYYLNNRTSDFTHINEFKWSRVGRSLCSKPDTSSMVRFRFETYPIKNNSITGVSTELQSQILKSTLNNINNGDVLKNIEDMQDFNSCMENTNKSFNTLLPKGIIDFVALLPPRNIPTSSIRNILGITQEVVDLLLTNLQTCLLPQKLDIYKYSPMTSLTHFCNQNNIKNDENNDNNNNNIVNNNSNNNTPDFGIPRKSSIGTGFSDPISNMSLNDQHLNNLPSSSNSNLDINKLQEIIQRSIPWISDNTSNMNTGTDLLSTTNTNNNTFFTPCNVPNPNRFSNKPKNSNSKVQIQL